MVENNLNLIIFDLDNTLYDFVGAWELSHKDLFNEMKLHSLISYSEFMNEYINQDNELWQKKLNGTINLTELRVLRVCRTFEKFRINFSEQAGQKFYQDMFEHLLDHMKLLDGIKILLEQLSKEYCLTILTNGYSAEQRRKIERLEISRYFDKIYISDEIGIEKPDKKAFQKILNDYKLEPSECLMIGDSYIHDIEPAVSLGLQTLHVRCNTLNNLSRILLDNQIVNDTIK